MALIDDRGRLFGRVNLIDASVAAFLLVLIPLAYGTARLFQPARPSISSVTRVEITNQERRIVAGGSLLMAKIKVRGTAFNPMLRATIGGSPALGFVFENPNSADVLVGPVPPGTHDLVLLDGVQEVARAAQAVTIEQPLPRAVVAYGWLLAMEPAMAAQLRVGSAFPPDSDYHKVIALGPDEPAKWRVSLSGVKAEVVIDGRRERRAAILLRCDPIAEEYRTGAEPCSIAGQVMSGAAPVTVALPGAITVGFAIEELAPTTSPRRVHVRLRVNSADLDPGLVHVGDRNRTLDERDAVVTAISRVEGNTFDVTLAVGLDESNEGFTYRGRVVRPGSSFAFESQRYEAVGYVRSVSILDRVPQDRR